MFKRYNKNGVLTLHIGMERITMIGESISYKIPSSPPPSLTGTYQLIKDLFSKEDTSSRSTPRLVKFVKKVRNTLTGKEGVAWSDGKTNQEQRRFMLTTLRDFGFGKSDMESLINDEVQHFCDAADEVLISAINKEDVRHNCF